MRLPCPARKLKRVRLQCLCGPEQTSGALVVGQGMSQGWDPTLRLERNLGRTVTAVAAAAAAVEAGGGADRSRVFYENIHLDNLQKDPQFGSRLMIAFQTKGLCENMLSGFYN
jgi:hypothetical protein